MTFIPDVGRDVVRLIQSALRQLLPNLSTSFCIAFRGVDECSCTDLMMVRVNRFNRFSVERDINFH